jgi:hypothetical protein
MIEYIGHYLIGGNPNDELGLWDTKGEALINFALQFAEMTKEAKHNYLFIRREPVIIEENDFSSERIGWKMIGRFSICKINEENK